MADNPLQYSDFINPDDSIKVLIDLLKQVKEELADVRKEAAGLAKDMKGTNDEAKGSKKSLPKVASEAEKLARAYEALKKSQSDTTKQIVLLRAQQKKQNNINKLTANLNQAAEGSYNRLSAQYSLNKLRLNALSGAQRNATKQGKLLEKQTKDIYTEMSRLQKATGKHALEVGNYAIATENLHPILGRVNTSLGAMGTNLGTLSKSKNPFATITKGAIAFGKAALTFLVSPIGLVITAVAGLYFLLSSNKDTVVEFDNGLKNVGKTTGLAAEELRGLGKEIVRLSKRLKTVGTPALLEYATVAGQLGVRGSENILAFAETLAKLETATDITGQEGATKIARLLTLTDGGVENVAAFGDEITNLGNNFAATEKEILGNATAIAQNVAQYDIGRPTVLAYATATKAVGLEAELTGSTMGRTLAVLEKSIRTGAKVNKVIALTGLTLEELKKQFKEDPGAVFTEFIAGLNETQEAGESLNAQLEGLSITSIRDQRVLSSLATKGYGVLRDAIDEVGASQGVLEEEFAVASSKLVSQTNRLGIAWDNLVLIVEDGQGVFASAAAFFVGAFAEALDQISAGIINFQASWSGLLVFLETGNAKLAELAYYSELIRSSNAATEGSEKQRESHKRTEDQLKENIITVRSLNEEIEALNESLKDTSTREEAKVIQKQIKLLERQRDAILGVVDARIKEQEKRRSEIEKAEAGILPDGENKELVFLEIELRAKTKLWKKYDLDLDALAEFGERRREEIRQKYEDLREKALEKERIRIAKANAEKYRDARRALDIEFQLANSEIDLLRKNEAEKTRLRLEAEKDRIAKIIELNKMAGADLSAQQIQILRNTISKIDQELGILERANSLDLYAQIGLSLEDRQKQAISDSAAFVVSNIRNIFAAKEAAADAGLQKNQEEISSAERKLSIEIQKRDEGLANNVQTIEKELAVSKKKEARLLKQKKKAQQDQANIDTLAQVSSLITASANTFMSLSQIPVVGPGLAIGAVSAMFASFALAKAQAAKLSKAQEFGEGGLEFLEGGSHQSGDDINIGSTKTGRRRTAEGGEALAVIRKSSTRKYRQILPKLINSLNSGTFEESFGKKFESDDAYNTNVINVGGSKELRSMDKNLHAMKIRKESETETYINGKGQMVQVYKNVKTTYV